MLESLKKQFVVRQYKRSESVNDLDPERVRRMMDEAGCTPGEAEEIFRLTSLPSETERYVFPPSHREQAIEMLQPDTWGAKGMAGFGFREKPVRGE